MKYRKSTDDIQWQTKEDISNRNSSPDVFIFADKTNNLYKAPPEQYKKLLKENVTKTYKKSTERLEKSINLGAKNIAKKLDLVERVECLAKNPAFITLKDHKEHFRLDYPAAWSIRCKKSTTLLFFFFSTNPCLLSIAQRFGRRLHPIFRQFFNLNNRNTIQWYSRWSTSNHVLDEEKKNKKLININVITRYNAIVVSCNEQLRRSSFSLFKHI